MDLVDALSSNTSAKSGVELTLSPQFQRSYSALNKALKGAGLGDQQLVRLATKTISEPKERPVYLLGVDVTSKPRPYAETLPDRGFVYQPNFIKGNKPITVGHQYSFVALLPERDKAKLGPWVVRMAMVRVACQDNKERVGAKQVRDILEAKDLPFGRALCVEVVDSAYSKPAYLSFNRDQKNLVTVARARGTRTFYREPVQKAEAKQNKGHPTWYGEPFCLNASETWDTPDEVAETTFTSQRKITYQVKIQAWHNLLSHGKKDVAMHKSPFTLVQIRCYTSKGEPLFQKPLWLMVIGERRTALSLLEIYAAYLQRYDLEHFFRFGKQKLLLDKFQTPDEKHEEKWWRIVPLAYLQLWAARDLVLQMPHPWERSLPSVLNKVVTPAVAQRDMARIIRQIGTPSPAPKPRGKSPGRPKGVTLPPRKRLKVVKKAKA